MAQADDPRKDRYERRLDEMLQKLQACQREREVRSCSRCERYLACELRTAYVGAVYDSMSRGETGGFEF